MHGPRDAEVQYDAALQAHERRRKVVHVEALGVLLALVVGAGAKEVGGVARNGQGLGVADGVEHAVQRVAADVSHRADAAGGLFDERGVRDAPSAAAAGLHVVDLAQHARVDDLLDHLHVLVKARLEADGQHLAALLLGAHDLHRFLGGHAHGLLQQHVDALFQRVDGAGRVLGVVGAHADRVQLLVVQHGLVVGVEITVLDAVALGELLRLAGDQIGHRHNLDVLHALIGLDVRLRNPARADDANAQLVLVAHLDLFLYDGLLKCAQYFIAGFCHCEIPSCLCKRRTLPPLTPIIPPSPVKGNSPPAPPDAKFHLISRSLLLYCTHTQTIRRQLL